jgi:hypothetical protein
MINIVRAEAALEYESGQLSLTNGDLAIWDRTHHEVVK